jgi:hypothetical protein
MMDTDRHMARELRMVRSIDWSPVEAKHVMSAIGEYDRLGDHDFFARFGFAPTTTYDLLVDGKTYPPKAILGAAYELATGDRLASSDFEGGRSGAVKVLTGLGFAVQERRPH